MIDAIKFRILSPRVGQEEESKSGTVLENEVAGGMKMNRKIHVSCVAAGALLASILGATAFQRESFEGAVADPWFASSNIVTSVGSPSPVHSGNSLSIPVMQWVSNAVPANLTNQVWTDFWTIPTVFNADGSVPGPSIDSNATVQFFVNSSSNWTVYSGGDSYVGYKTNSTSTLDVTNHTTFHQVSVLSDYSNKTFSFFVNDVCLWKDLNFMTTNLSAAQWFQVQNLGGAAANVCYLDEYTLTNRLGGSVLTNPVPGSSISVADALQYFGTTNNPIPSNTTVATENNSATWSFASAVSGETYTVLGSTSPSSDFDPVSGAVVNGTNLMAYLGSGTNRYFQKIVRMSGAIRATNTEVYAAYKLPRAINSVYITGVSVAYKNPEDAKLSGELGTQLKMGLVVGDRIFATDTNGNTDWSEIDSSGWSRPLDGMTFAPGSSFCIQTCGTPGSQSSYVLAGLKESGSPIVNRLASNVWTYVSWAADDTNTVGVVPGLAPQVGDYLFYQSTASNTIMRSIYTASGWHSNIRGTGTQKLTLGLKAGDGLIFKNTSGEIKTLTQQ